MPSELHYYVDRHVYVDHHVYVNHDHHGQNDHDHCAQCDDHDYCHANHGGPNHGGPNHEHDLAEGDCSSQPPGICRCHHLDHGGSCGPGQPSSTGYRCYDIADTIDHRATL